MKQLVVSKNSQTKLDTIQAKRSLHFRRIAPQSSFFRSVHRRLQNQPPLLSPTTLIPKATPSVPPYSDSEESDSSNSLVNNAKVEVDLEALAAAEHSIAQQQAAGLTPPYDLAATKVSILDFLLNNAINNTILLYSMYFSNFNLHLISIYRE